MKRIDVVRGITPRELANLLANTEFCSHCNYRTYDTKDCEGEHCSDTIYEWLNQKAPEQSIFEPKEGETIYYIDECGEVLKAPFTESGSYKALTFGNYCTDKAVMERKAHEMKLWSLLWNFAEENNSEMDWSDSNQTKCYVCKYMGEYIVDGAQSFKDFQPYFSSKELAQRAIDEIVIPWERGEL